MYDELNLLRDSNAPILTQLVITPPLQPQSMLPCVTDGTKALMSKQ